MSRSYAREVKGNEIRKEDYHKVRDAGHSYKVAQVVHDWRANKVEQFLNGDRACLVEMMQ
jgi:hypothetical protein